MTFVQRAISATIQLGEGTFGTSGFNTIQLPSGLRIRATIEKYAAPGFNTGVFRIYGMTLSEMNAISTNWVPLPYWKKNVISVAAGDATTGMSVVFQGGIKTAVAVLDDPPDNYFEIVALTGMLETMQPAAPSSFPGAADVATIMSGLASKMGLAFENAGVSGLVLNSPYFAGNLWDQAKAVAQAANVNLYVDDVKGALVIYPQGASRTGQAPLISKATGMDGYPRYTGSGIGFRTLFNPAIQFAGTVQVQSEIQPACGMWVVNRLTYDLESQLPGGNWFCDVEGYSLGSQ